MPIAHPFVFVEHAYKLYRIHDVMMVYFQIILPVFFVDFGVVFPSRVLSISILCSHFSWFIIQEINWCTAMVVEYRGSVPLLSCYFRDLLAILTLLRQCFVCDLPDLYHVLLQPVLLFTWAWRHLRFPLMLKSDLPQPLHALFCSLLLSLLNRSIVRAHFLGVHR